jgi:hypothetical protein
MGDPGPVIASIAFFITVLGSFVLFGPIGRAFADRLRHKDSDRALDTGEVEALREELDTVRRQVAELAERQDFTERLLAQARERGMLPAPKER